MANFLIAYVELEVLINLINCAIFNSSKPL